MRLFPLLLTCIILNASCVTRYYVVRHAEKAAPGPNMTSDVSLSPIGMQRADALMQELRNSKIEAIHSTNTIRTKSTAEPLSRLLDLPIQVYGPMPDSAFISRIRQGRKNALIVGHSNTVDDIVNGLAGRKVVPGDLEDSEYDNLFVVRHRRGLFSRLDVEQKKF